MDLTSKAVANKIKGGSSLLSNQLSKTGKSVEELRDIFNFDNLTATLDATLEEEVLIFPP